MTGLETRDAARESVLLLAGLAVKKGSKQHRVRIRDLSAQGLRAEGDVLVQPGEQVELDFGSAGKVSGLVAWCEGITFGVALEHEIEPDVVRRAMVQKDAEGYETPWFLRSLGQVRHHRRPSRKV